MRLDAIVIALVVSLAPLVAAEAQQPAKPPTVGFVGPGPRDCGTRPPPQTGPGAAFFRGLRELGYSPGQNITVDRRCFVTPPDLDGIMNDFVARRVDVIFAGTGAATLAAHRATKMIPIVGLHTDPVGAGLAASLARPGGNLTGLTFTVAAAGGLAKRIDLVKELLPRASRIAVLDEPSRFGAVFALASVRTEQQAVAEARGVTLRFIDVQSAEDLDDVLATVKTQSVDAVIVTGASGVLFGRRRQVVDWANENRIPSMFMARDFVNAGGLMFWNSSFPALYHRAASYVDKIVRGARPADLPIEQPTTFEFVINLRTAKTLGLTIPPSLLLRADEIIE